MANETVVRISNEKLIIDLKEVVRELWRAVDTHRHYDEHIRALLDTPYTPAPETLSVDSNMMERLQNERLTWGVACPCSCDACERFYDVIRDMEDKQADARPVCPQCGQINGFHRETCPLRHSEKALEQSPCIYRTGCQSPHSCAQAGHCTAEIANRLREQSSSSESEV